MPLKYKLDIISALKEAGHTTYKLRKDKTFNETVIHQLRSGVIVNWKQIEKICAILNCQPGDLVEYVPSADSEEANTCENCKHLDGCPADYQQEQANWCENWEQC